MSTPVTQTDRDAAADYLQYVTGTIGASSRPAILAGEWDDTEHVTAFAQHAVRAAERMRSACADVADNHIAMGYMSGRERSYCHEHGDEIAEAIRALDPSTILEGSNDG